MRELIFRRSIYNETIAHKLYETEKEGEWEYKTPEDWMPMYFTYDCSGRGNNIIALDGEGFGTPLCVGEKVQGLPPSENECVLDKPLTVSKIFVTEDNKHLIVKLV